MKIRRLFSSALFPWKFNNRVFSNLSPVTEQLKAELSEEKQGFVWAFDQTLQAIEELNIEFLKEIMEPNLLAKYTSGFEQLAEQGYKIKAINKGSSTNPSFYNENAFDGLHVIRSENEGWKSHQESKARKLPKIFENLESDNKDSIKVPPHKIITYTTGLNYLILKVDVVYNSASKIILENKDSEVIEGEISENIESHKFRFEKMTILPASIIDRMKIMKRFYNYCWMEPDARFNDIFEDAEWMITDIDDCLEGNPYELKK